MVARMGRPKHTKAIVMTQTHPVDKPGHSGFYKPPDQLLNGDCIDADGYYIKHTFLLPLWSVFALCDGDVCLG
jgi:hypothetical protein